MAGRSSALTVENFAILLWAFAPGANEASLRHPSVKNFFGRPISFHHLQRLHGVHRADANDSEQQQIEIGM
jgi:hypothetical protein